jgi:predicted alpha/beta superfamily hydrolase
MYIKSFSCFLMSLAFIVRSVFAQIDKAPPYPPVQLSGTQLIKFKSAINNKDYEIYIELPASYKDSSLKKYPVLYVLDGQWIFPQTIAIREGLRFESFIPEMIVVGIGWPDHYHPNRDRDFTPTRTMLDSASGGAEKFLSVIKNEIIKFIDSAYRSDKKNNVLLGQSSGGLFALYTLFHEPELFNNYIVMCPSLDYDDGITFKYEKAFAENHHILNVKLFLTSSEYEEDVLRAGNFGKFIQQLKSSNYKGLELDSLVVLKMGHATQNAYATGRGLQFIFSRPDIILDASLLDQYAGNYEHGVSFTRVGNSLFWTDVRTKTKLHAANNNSFYMNGASGTGEFTKDNNGKVVGVNLKMENQAFFLKKID